MSKLDLMKDPFYAQIMFVIEGVICHADEAARAQGVRLTDSNIKSALNKARRMTPEQRLAVPAEPPDNRDGIVAELARSIVAQREIFRQQAADGTRTEVSLADWSKAISAVEASLKVRQGAEPGGREYLDFVWRFITERRL